MDSRVTMTVDRGVADVRLTRPEKLNAMDGAMFEALIETGERLKSQAGLRAVVLSGEGEAFCSGLDLNTFDLFTSGPSRRGRPNENRRWDAVLETRSHGIANRLQYAVWVWREVPVPVIAAVHGTAIANGFQLALGADIRIVAPDAELAIAEVNWGLVPDTTGSQLMRHLAREDVVRMLTYTGRHFSGEEALAFGFATLLSTDPRGDALKLAHEIAAKSPDAIRAAKRLLSAAVISDPATGLMQETVEQLALIGSPNQVEAILANMQKRPPRFSDPAP
ncbi:MAG TPA: crotonase/enoyl-CoA hydratase family protein [Caulobacteraceae bacterium]|nr:crotonase/enoyl-CoA hydratase family protein [Caulobacteraceae bacterium]